MFWKFLNKTYNCLQIYAQSIDTIIPKVTSLVVLNNHILIRKSTKEKFKRSVFHFPTKLIENIGFI